MESTIPTMNMIQAIDESRLSFMCGTWYVIWRAGDMLMEVDHFLFRSILLVLRRDCGLLS